MSIGNFRVLSTIVRMEIKQCLIIEDAESDALYLKKLLSQFAFLKLVGVAPTIDSAVQCLETQHVDLLFLDIRLNGQLGFMLLKLGLTLPPVIVTTAYADYAVESYEIGKVSDYLLKPFTLERLHLALTRVFTEQSKASVFEQDGVFLKMGRKTQRFVFQSIHYVEAFGVYTKVYADNQMYLVTERLNALLGQLPPRLFIRVHKSFVINISKVTGYDRHTIWLNQTKIPIGRSYRSELEKLLSIFDASDERLG